LKSGAILLPRAPADVATRADQLEKTAEVVKEISQNQVFTKESLGG
jgi:hypothetical protein